MAAIIDVWYVDNIYWIAHNLSIEIAHDPEASGGFL
jgi:hypothetical protein